LFPAEARPGLAIVGQVGLVVFMFLVGLEFNTRAIRGGRVVALASAGAAFAPLAAGIALAPLLFAAFRPAHVDFPPFALFIGVALSITAFPVLARILRERGIERTPVGALALAIAALNDALGWCMLAAVVAAASSGSPRSAVLALAGSALLAVVVLGAGRPLLTLTQRRVAARRGPARVVGAAVTLAPACAWISEALGGHVLFGAFLAGVAWPKGGHRRVAAELRRALEPLTSALLLPVFFFLPGLTVNLREVTAGGFAYFLLILLVAIGAKVLGAAAGCRLAGVDRRAALTIGALMNTRGLMELIVLNVGLEAGILRPDLYVLLVLMAICTTMMTGPLLTRLPSLHSEGPGASTGHPLLGAEETQWPVEATQRWALGSAPPPRTR
jgi:Kef-type K+ transport system membrane component KefB